MTPNNYAKSLRQNMTEAEQLLWKHLRAHRLGSEKFRRQQTLGPYIVDFVHFGARLVIEADGGQHNGAASDTVRDAWLKSQGYRVLRFWNHAILQNVEGVLVVVMGALAEVRPPLPRPLSHKGRGESESPSPPAGEGLGRGGDA